MFLTDFIFRQQENLVDNQKCQAGFRPLCNKILLLVHNYFVKCSCLIAKSGRVFFVMKCAKWSFKRQYFKTPLKHSDRIAI